MGGEGGYVGLRKGVGEGRKMTQILYAHMNKKFFLKWMLLLIFTFFPSLRCEIAMKNFISHILSR
jgi:hypothetical protein